MYQPSFMMTWTVLPLHLAVVCEEKSAGRSATQLFLGLVAIFHMINQHECFELVYSVDTITFIVFFR